MKKDKRFPMIALAIVFAALCLTACNGRQAGVPANNLVQVVEGATTRGGYSVSGPISGGERGWAYGAYYGDISDVGYIEEEFFIEGTDRKSVV